MGRVSNYILNSGMADSVVNLLVAEFTRNIGEVKRNTGAGHNYSKWDSVDTVQILNVEMVACQLLLSNGTVKNSVPGEATIPALFSSAFNCVDVATLHNNGTIVLTECKCAIKRTGFGPFFDETTFVNGISVKFDEVERRMNNDGDTIARKRIIVVASALIDRVIELVDDLIALQMPTGSFSTDGKQHDYVLCSSASLCDVINNVCPSSLFHRSYKFTL